MKLKQTILIYREDCKKLRAAHNKAIGATKEGAKPVKAAAFYSRVIRRGLAAIGGGKK